MKRRPTDLEVARAIHHNESLRAPEPQELSHDEVVELFDDDGYPPPCPGRKDHSWVIADEDNGGDGRCYCEYCGADGDA